jgi:hypothetical protein
MLFLKQILNHQKLFILGQSEHYVSISIDSIFISASINEILTQTIEKENI